VLGFDRREGNRAGWLMSQRYRGSENQGEKRDPAERGKKLSVKILARKGEGNCPRPIRLDRRGGNWGGVFPPHLRTKKKENLPRVSSQRSVRP